MLIIDLNGVSAVSGICDPVLKSIKHLDYFIEESYNPLCHNLT